MRTSGRVQKLVFRRYLGAVIGLLLLCASGVFIWGLTGETRLECDRNQAICVYQQKRAFAPDEPKIIPLDSIEGTELERFPGNEKYQAVLHTRDGSVVLSHYNSSARLLHASFVDKVNEFLTSPDQATLDFRHRPWWVTRLVPWSGVAIGLIMLWAGGDKVTVIAAPGTKRLMIDNAQWWEMGSWKFPQHELDFDRIDGVEIDTQDEDQLRTHRVLIRLSSGEQVPLFDQGFSSEGAALRRKRTLEAFLQRAGILSHPSLNQRDRRSEP